MDWKTKDLQQAAMARELSENFFRSRVEQPEVSNGGSAAYVVETIPAPVSYASSVTIQEEAAEAPTELYPRGSFIDVQA